MKRGYAKLYLVVLILLVGFSFFFNFGGMEEITGKATSSENICTFDVCLTDVYVNGEVVGRANVCKKNGKVSIRERASEFPEEYYPDVYGGSEISTGEYDIKLDDGRDAIVYFSFTEENRWKCSDQKISEDKTGLRSLLDQRACSSYSAEDCPTDKCRVINEEQTQVTGGCTGVVPKTVRRCVEKNICRFEEEAQDTATLYFERTDSEFGLIVNLNSQSLFQATTTDGQTVSLQRHNLNTLNPLCALYTFRLSDSFSGNSPLIFSHESVGPDFGEFFKVCNYRFNLPDDAQNINYGCEIGPFAIPKDAQCPLTKPCDVSYSMDKDYAFYVLGDKCGNKIAMRENTGESLTSLDELPTRSVVEATCILLYSLEGEENLCDNGRIDWGEECDGDNLGGKTCQTVDPKFTSGDLKCDSECKFDTSECECDRITNLGMIEVKGGIYNYVIVIVDDIRMVGYYKMDASMLQSSRDDVGIIGDTVVKMWIHKHLFSANYDDFTEYDPTRDFFDLSNHFPPKNWGSANSFVIIFETSIKRKGDGKFEIILKSKYKKSDDSFELPYDAEGLIINNPYREELTERKDITNFETNLRAVAQSTTKALKMYIVFHDSDFKDNPLYGVGVNGNKGGGVFVNTLVNDLVRNADLHGIDDSELKKGQKFDRVILPKIYTSLNNKIQRAKESYSC